VRLTGIGLNGGLSGLPPTWRCEQQEHQSGVVHLALLQARWFTPCILHNSTYDATNLARLQARLFTSQRAFDVAKEYHAHTQRVGRDGGLDRAADPR